MKFPPYLSSGDHVAILSPAGKIARQVAERGADALRRQGFVVAIGQHAFDEAGVFAGSDAARAADMQQALDDRSIKAAANGGLPWILIYSPENSLCSSARPAVASPPCSTNSADSIHPLAACYTIRVGISVAQMSRGSRSSGATRSALSSKPTTSSRASPRAKMSRSSPRLPATR